MKLYKLHEKSKAVCPFCKQLRATTFEERDVPLSSGRGKARDILVAVCNTCNNVVGIPQQSVPRVNEAIGAVRHSVEARIPRHLLDVIALACHDLGFSSDNSAVLFRYYLDRLAKTPRISTRLTKLSISPDAQGSASARFSAKLNDDLYQTFLALEHKSNLNKAGVIKAVIIQMKKDILDDRRKPVRRALQNILRLAS